MLKRWDPEINDLKVFLNALNELINEPINRSKRGRKPKHDLRSYLKLIIIKEANKASLREAEIKYSKIICKERIDHSVIHYWEKKFDSNLIERLVKNLGNKIEKILDYAFSILDSTKFTSWNKNLIEFHLLIRKSKENIYPVSIAFGSEFLTPLRAIVNGKGELFIDSWYDNNLILKHIFKAGYLPIVKPNKSRNRKYWRRKARKIWNNLKDRYKQRWIGESIFGSLTNWLGDRLKTILMFNIYYNNKNRNKNYSLFNKNLYKSYFYNNF
jgi:hypothetical protein